LKTHPNANHAADIGTGSGCIPVTLAVYAPHLRFDAGDISMDALAVARSNAALHKVEKRIRFVQSNLLETLPGHYDLITANLPYIPIKTLTGLAVTHYEPNLALDGGPDGLQFIRRLLQQATTKLKPGGFMLLEIEATIGPATLACASEFWPNAAIRLEKDLAGLDRYLLLYTS
jgi:release factor glutamine methyltransferase